MVDFIFFVLVCAAIFMLANTLKRQLSRKPLQPIRIETEEELRRKKRAQIKNKQIK